MLENALQLALYSKENSVPLKFLKSVDGEIVDTTKAISNDIVTYYMLYKYSIDDTIMIYYHENKDKDDDELSVSIIMFLRLINEEQKINNYTLSLIKDVRRIFDMKWEGLLSSTIKRIEKLTSIKEFFDGIELNEETRQSLNNSFTDDNVVKSYSYEYEKFDITKENGKYIFNQFGTDKSLFYIEYIDDEGNSMIKIHDTAEKNLLETEETSKNTLYFKYKHQHDVINIKFDILTHKIEYSYYAGKNSSEIDGIIQTIFSNFRLSDPKTMFISGSFSIDIKNYKEYNFYYFIFMLVNLINKDASNLIYMKETFNPRALKKRAKYYFRDLENINRIDYIMSFTVDNVLSNLYNIKYRAKNKEKSYILEIAYLIKKYMSFYEENSTITGGGNVSDYFVNEFYDKTFQYNERSYTRIPTKIATMRNKSQAEKMFPSGGEYTKGMCECKLQPIIVDKEDIEDWENYEDSKSGRTIKHNTILFPPENSSQGPKRNYVCPTHHYPIPILKPNTGSNAKEYPYLPCCKMTGKDNYYDFYEETRLEGKGPIISLKQSDIQTRSLPLPLQSFFKAFVDDQVEIKPVEVNINDSFISCLLHATKDYTPPRREGHKNYKILYNSIESYKKDYKEGVKKIRKNINMFKVHFETLKQEMFDYTTDDIINILTQNEYIDSMMFFKFFEYIFSVNIFVFNVINDKPVLEKPRYKDFHVRNIIEDFPAVCLYRDPDVQKGRYSVIGGKNMTFSSKIFQNLLQSYYKTEIKDNSVITRVNPYQGIIWEKIFKNYKIVNQKINENGKCYRLTIQIGKAGLSIYIPPSAPLNVPESSKIYKGTFSSINKIFTNGTRGSDGLWFEINGMKEVFIPCYDIEKSDDICFNYVKDCVKSNTSYDNYKISSRNAGVLTEICVWLWRISGVELEEWFLTYIDYKSPNTGIFEKYQLNGKYILPKYNSVPQCLDWLSKLNPNFPDLFKGEKLNIYEDLKDNLYLYMKKLESLTDGLSHNPSLYMETLLRDKNDYNIGANELLFDNKIGLDDWKNNKFHNLQIFDTLENRGIYIYQNDKGMYLISSTNSLEETLLTVLYWNKHKKIPNSDIFTPQLRTGVKYKTGYRLLDTKLNVIKEEKNHNIINVIFYRTNLYSTFIKII